MKTIEQVALEYALKDLKISEEQAKHWKHKLIIDVTIRDFKAGFEFAQQWINVNDELPEENVYVLVMQDDSDYTDIAYLAYLEDGEWYYSNSDLQLSFNPTHWRNI